MIAQTGHIPTVPNISPDTYSTITKATMKKGIREAECEFSSEHLSQSVDNRYCLRELAFKPTGVALGVPLPDPLFTDTLHKIAIQLEQELSLLSINSESCFAFVPKEYYHVTLVNRTHYERDSTVSSMIHEEFKKVKEVIKNTPVPFVSLFFDGLVVTSSGRVFVPGYPQGESFYTVKNDLVRNLSFLRNKIPPFAHIKLGHITCLLSKKQSDAFLQTIKQTGTLIHQTITFTSLHTPRGEITLG